MTAASNLPRTLLTQCPATYVMPCAVLQLLLSALKLASPFGVALVRWLTCRDGGGVAASAAATPSRASPLPDVLVTRARYDSMTLFPPALVYAGRLAPSTLWLLWSPRAEHVATCLPVAAAFPNGGVSC